MPCVGAVAAITAWLIAVPRIRALAVELGVELPWSTTVLVDYGGVITAVAVTIAVLVTAVAQFVPHPAIRLALSLVVSLLLVILTAWDLVVFWLVYVGTLGGLSAPVAS